ncbi:hypothetical protein F0562_016443 [Nyssa sinensis]|uniref:Uncharacterized protein n=1 Tax=Nyssa sinensis TaxID=561372 RepID=A0A5J4ZJ48_9ASTE|nr:hypothetical protein F0562_016443 [Nyssa sinensis]
MKVASKPISSPGRTENFPPPLMRFLKSNVGSRSRGRSRSSPMFMRKKNTVIETQEPSSPKVTCIGQVRVKTVLQTIQFKVRPLQNSGKRTPLLVDTRDDFSKNESNQKVKYKATDIEDEDEEDEDEEARVKEVTEVFHSSSPPKNALLLTRCRSAPYRSSSLASRFWGSPLVTSETEDANEEKKAQQEGDREQERPESESESDCKNSISQSRIDQENEENSKEVEGSIDGRLRENDIYGSSARPLILTRCKSEPARTGGRLNPDACQFLERQKVGFC